ncbi:MAG: DNA cytosine methyltransferase [Ignavibacteria bacterium]|nr:DNA cytosine methyltransferase [Ignavibacteria bacterium]
MYKRTGSVLKIKDQFCGAGGTSQGAKRLIVKLGGGLEITVAVNHWKIALQTHARNFPNTLHVQTNMATSKPERFPTTDILLTSPECTWQGYARNKSLDKIKAAQSELFNDDAEERSRATMWDVPRFAEFHNYGLIIVENVPGAYKWINFPDWLNAMTRQGYDYKINYLNSMFFHPTPQSRDRMYIVFWKKGNRIPDLEFTPNAYCHKCEHDNESIQTWKKDDFHWGAYGQRRQYTYNCSVCNSVVEPYRYAAFNIIDWTNPGKLIGDRLAPATRNRIQMGIDRYNDEPFMLKVNRSLKDYSIFEPLYTIAAGGRHHGIVTPFIVENKGKSTVRDVQEALSTVTTVPYHGIVTTDSWHCFLNYYYKTPQFTSLSDAIRTITTKDRTGIVTFQKPKIGECYYRMLGVKEIHKGMNFDDDYIVLGSPEEQVRQYGNAVNPQVMTWLLERGIQTFN